MKLNKSECAVAVCIIIFGAVMAYFGSFYGIGSLQDMGAGYFPVLLGFVTIFFGIATLLEVRHSQNPPPKIPWRAFVCVFSAILIWSLLVERIGLFPSSVLLVIIGSLGRSKITMRAMILTALLASAASVLIFIEGFSLPLRVVAW
jgi:Tripartite tricarboxylate transporter TctB family